MSQLQATPLGRHLPNQLFVVVVVVVVAAAAVQDVDADAVRRRGRAVRAERGLRSKKNK